MVCLVTYLYTSMNYTKHYNLLMERARHRTLEVYCESHHILPICMGGKGTEEVLLTPEEHFVAHQLLVKMYPGNSKLIYAANMQGNTNNKKYGWLRRKFSEHISKQFKGKRFSPATEFKKGRKPIGKQFQKGHKTWNKGKTGIFSVDALQIMSEKRKGNQHALGAIRSEETRKKISIARKGKRTGPMSPEHKAKVAASLIGRKRVYREDGTYYMSERV